MAKSLKAITLETEDIEYVEQLAKREKRNFSNMVGTIITRYKKIMEQVDQGLKVDSIFGP